MNQGKMERMLTLTPLAWAISFFFQVQVDGGKDQNSRNDASVRKVSF